MAFRQVRITLVTLPTYADETRAENYDFTFTDHLIKAIIDAGVEPYYRLGEEGVLCWAPKADVIDNHTVLLIEC